MLKQLLHEIESAPGPIQMAELSRRLNMDISALEGMVAFWIRKGRLYTDDADNAVSTSTSGHCGSSCTGADKCAFVAKMPICYSVQQETR